MKRKKMDGGKVHAIFISLVLLLFMNILSLQMMGARQGIEDIEDMKRMKRMKR